MLEPELAVKPGLPLQVGTKVRAVRNVGPVKKGAPGIITGLTDSPLFWWSRPAYLCTFADNMKVHARPKLIEAFDHGYNLEELDQPDFTSSLIAANDVAGAAIVFRATSDICRKNFNSRCLTL